MCDWGNTKDVHLKIAADLSYTGKDRWAWKGIDDCIVGIVEALQRGGIDMRYSCCGHGGMFGNISLQDGRVLLIATKELHTHQGRYLFKLWLTWVKLSVVLTASNIANKVKLVVKGVE